MMFQSAQYRTHKPSKAQLLKWRWQQVIGAFGFSLAQLLLDSAVPI